MMLDALNGVGRVPFTKRQPSGRIDTSSVYLHVISVNSSQTRIYLRTYVITHRLRVRVIVQLNWAIEVIPPTEIRPVGIAEVPPRPVPIHIALLNTLFSKLDKPSSLDRITPDLVDSVPDLHEGVGGPVSLSREGFHLWEQLHESVKKQISATATVLT